MQVCTLFHRILGKMRKKSGINQKEQLKVAGLDTVLSQKRGTSTIVARDIPDVPQPSLKGQKITTKRGTSVETL